MSSPCDAVSYPSCTTKRSGYRRSPPDDSDREPCATETSPIRASSMQCAAVSTHDGAISDPPQKCLHRPARPYCSDTCHGAMPGGAS